MEELNAKFEYFQKKFNQISNFQEKYSVLLIQKSVELYNELNDYIPQLPSQDITSEQGLYSIELQSRLITLSNLLGNTINLKEFDLDDISNIYRIPVEDISYVQSYLESNKEQVLNLLYSNFDKENIERKMPLYLDIPDERKKIEKLAKKTIIKYHNILKKIANNTLFLEQDLDKINIVPTTKTRSFHDSINHFCGISIDKIIYRKKDFSVDINVSELINIYGHEFMGHALHHTQTQNGDIPYILKDNNSFLISGSSESIAQFYEFQIFNEIRNNPDIAKELGINNFEEVYKNHMESRLIKCYQDKLEQYAIIIFADKKYGNPFDNSTIEKKSKELSKYAIDRSWLDKILNSHLNNYDRKGNYNSPLIHELKYTAQPVNRILTLFSEAGIKYEGEGKNLIDKTLLTGFWSHNGMIQNASNIIQKIQKP